MSEPRFVVTKLTGYRIGRHGARWDGNQTTSYYVQDTLYLYKVVAVFNATTGGSSYLDRQRRRAEALAAELNAKAAVHA